MDLEKLRQEALDFGFTLAAPIAIDTIHLRDEVREMCAVNKCHAYNTNWGCPPACGTVEECQARVNSYTSGLVVQTTGQLEDDFDFETMQETAKLHGQHFVDMLCSLRAEHPELDILPLGTGACMNCKKCTYPDAPCRFPDKMSSPMEGYGMIISDVCRDNGILYNHGRGTLTYVACFLFREVD
jgi:predicted metal-binding protein